MSVNYEYSSCFAHYIEDLIRQKQQEGFVYETEVYHLKCFDTFCEKNKIAEPCITKELMLSWGTLRDSEGKSYLSRRVSAVRQLCLYMQSLGLDSYIPTHFYKNSHAVAHVLDDAELTAFFEQVDSYYPSISASVFMRLSMEYRVLFRMILCCGLRVSEARKLKIEDANLEDRKLIVHQSKGRKDRIVYMSNDLCKRCRGYLDAMKKIYGLSS